MTNRLLRALAPIAMIGALATSCGPGEQPGVVRLATDEFELRAVPDMVPPRALERITYTVVVKDRETKEPIVNGEGRLFATNADRATSWDGFKYGPEAGTYRATITFVTAGEWALGIEFRRDSTKALQRTLDWRQQVRNELAPGTP